MKKAILTPYLLAMAWSVYGQGQIVLNNLANDNLSPLATSRGLVWLSTGGSTSLINQDFNLALYGGTNSSSLAPLATLLLSNGTALHDNAAPGMFIEVADNVYTIQGATISAYLQI